MGRSYFADFSQVGITAEMHRLELPRGNVAWQVPETLPCGHSRVSIEMDGLRAYAMLAQGQLETFPVLCAVCRAPIELQRVEA